MGRLVFFLALAVGTLFTFSDKDVRAAEPDWSLVPGAKTLNDKQKENLSGILKSGKSYGICKNTLMNCLSAPRPDPVTKRIVKNLVRHSILGADEEYLFEILETRRLSASPEKVHAISTDDLPPSGKKSAPVRVIVYADFECPYCRMASVSLRKISQEHPDLLAFYFKNFPLKSHPESLPAALALLAAGKQGKFWEMHDALFEAKHLSEKSFEELGRKLGLDAERYKKDRNDEHLVQEITKQKIEGLTFGLMGTPGIFVNGKEYHGPKNHDDLLDRIKEEHEWIGSEKKLGKGK